MKERSKEFTAELTDGFILAMMIAFTAWVALTQSATLAAPTTALFTAVLLAPRVKTPHKTLAEELHRPFVGIGTTLTAFLWLLSTTQLKTDIMPTDFIEAFIILIGLTIATAIVVLNPIVFIIPRLRANKEKGDPAQDKYKDYVAGILGSVAAFFLVFFMLKVSEGLIGPMENEGFMIAFAVIGAPAFGWFFVFTERRRKIQRSQMIKDLALCALVWTLGSECDRG